MTAPLVLLMPPMMTPPMRRKRQLQAVASSLTPALPLRRSSGVSLRKDPDRAGRLEAEIMRS